MNLKRFMPLCLLCRRGNRPGRRNRFPLDRRLAGRPGSDPATPRQPTAPRNSRQPTRPPPALPWDRLSPRIPASPPCRFHAMPANRHCGRTNAVAECRMTRRRTSATHFPRFPLSNCWIFMRTLLAARYCAPAAAPSPFPATATVTLKTESPLTRSEAIMALETILGMNGITIVPIGDKFAKVVTEASAPAGGRLDLRPIPNLPIAGKIVTQIIQVKYAAVARPGGDPYSLSPECQNSIIALPSTQTLILRDYAENVARMLEMVKKIDVADAAHHQAGGHSDQIRPGQRHRLRPQRIGRQRRNFRRQEQFGREFRWRGRTGNGTTGVGGSSGGFGGGSRAAIPASRAPDHQRHWLRRHQRAQFVPEQSAARSSTTPPAPASSNFSARPRSSPTNGPIPSWSSPTTRT